jgi:hypothetical protein
VDIVSKDGWVLYNDYKEAMHRWENNRSYLDIL